ncbi:MAG: hypothetical protein IPP17_30780 [Bacteroidetes bacterium]|nr:hypothetical protein [Bacteroidota bacterium]
MLRRLQGLREDVRRRLAADSQDILNSWDKKNSNTKANFSPTKSVARKSRLPTSDLAVADKIPKIALPRFKDYGEILRWRLPRKRAWRIPYTAGVFPFKRTGEDPTRMFAGEGGPGTHQQALPLREHGACPPRG